MFNNHFSNALNPTTMNNETPNKLLKVFGYSLLSILSFLFVTPLKLWLKAADRIHAQKEAGSLNITNIQSDWPFLSYLKRFTLDFCFDAMAFLAYPLGFILAVWAGIDSGLIAAKINEWSDVGSKVSVFWSFVEEFFICLLLAYFAPLVCYILHDLFVVLLLPIRKFIDWAKKPAQQMDLDIKNK